MSEIRKVYSLAWLMSEITVMLEIAEAGDAVIVHPALYEVLYKKDHMKWCDLQSKARQEGVQLIVGEIQA